MSKLSRLHVTTWHRLRSQPTISLLQQFRIGTLTSGQTLHCVPKRHGKSRSLQQGRRCECQFGTHRLFRLELCWGSWLVKLKDRIRLTLEFECSDLEEPTSTVDSRINDAGRIPSPKWFLQGSSLRSVACLGAGFYEPATCRLILWQHSCHPVGKQPELPGQDETRQSCLPCHTRLYQSPSTSRELAVKKIWPTH